MKRRNKNNTDDFIKLLDEQTRIGLNNLYHDIQKRAKEDIELSQKYTDLTLNLLMLKKSGKARLDQLFLDKNGINISLDYFIDKQDILKYGYAEIIKESKNYFILKITESGKNHFNTNSEKYLVFIPTKFDRLKYSINRNIPSFKRVVKFIGFAWKYGWKLIVCVTIILGGIAAFVSIRHDLNTTEKKAKNNPQIDQSKQDGQNNIHIDSTDISKTDSLSNNLK